MKLNYVIATVLLALPFVAIAETGCSTATCEEVCETMHGSGCEEASDCVQECQGDEARAASCGEEDAWQDMLDCCVSESYEACEEDFDACQKGDACGSLRPAGARDGC